MNKISLAHTNVQNQPQPSSRIDDLFQFGASTGKRMSHMRTLTEHAIDLVSRYARYKRDHYELTLDMLPDYEQNELARLYIESIDREIEWACYGDDESINNEFLCAMLSMLKDDTAATRARFAEVTRANILVYYRQALIDLLDNACDDYYRLQMNEQGYYAYQDQEHGDVLWGKC